MKKLFLIIVIAFACGFSAYANYEKNYPITVTQPDGTEVHCFATGDEFYNWVHDENGFTLIRDAQTGVVVYAKLENDELLSTGYRVGSIDPATIGLTSWLNISGEKRMKMRSEYLKNFSGEEEYQGSRGGQNNGTLNNIVIYIRFSDEVEFPANGDKYNGFFNTAQSSMSNYFTALSNEQLSVSTTFYPVSSGSNIISYQDIYPRSYFQPYNATTNPNGYQPSEEGIREQQLLKRAVEAVESEVPTDLELDFRHDGKIGNVCFIVSGRPGAWSSLLWPHRSWLMSVDARIHGVRVWDYNFQIEKELDGSGSSVLAHEMFHSLGAPDLYRYVDETIDPVGAWDLMCANANPPQTTNAWMKYKYGGWIDDIPEITENGTYELHNVWSETNNAYKIKSPVSTTEFFVIEYRDKNVYWDSGLPGSGLIVYRVNTLRQGNANGPPDEIYIFRPGGTTNTTPGNIRTAHFSASTGRTAFNNASNPPCFLSNNNPGGIAIFNISEAEGETMTFEMDSDLVWAKVDISPESLTFANIPIGTTSEPQTATVIGLDLYYAISYEITGADSELFAAEKISWSTYSGGTLAVTFTPDIINPDPNKIYTAKLTAYSTGTAQKSINLKGSRTGVAIDEHDISSKIEIYPNPTDGKLTIEMGDMRYETCDIEIYDVLGRKHQISDLTPNQVQGQDSNLKFDISHLPSGIYFVKIKTATDVITRKVVKE